MARGRNVPVVNKNYDAKCDIITRATDWFFDGCQGPFNFERIYKSNLARNKRKLFYDIDIDTTDPVQLDLAMKDLLQNKESPDICQGFSFDLFFWW